MGMIFEKKELKWRPDRTFDKSKDTSQVPTSEFNLPLVNAKHGDNGIMFYGRFDEWDSTDMAIDIVSNGAIATGDVYPQPQNTGVLWDAYLIKLVDGTVSAEVLMYLAGVIEKSIKLLYSYDNKAVWNKVRHDMIGLPIQTDAAGRPVIDQAKTYHPDGFVPDWDYMAAYIRAIEKLVIKDVVDFKDAFISKAKEAVGA